MLLHIVRHIGNVYAKHIIVAIHRERNRIVKILGILPIDRHHLPVA